MKLNPFSTLAGRLILVTIVAIAISHIVAFTLFANESGRTIRRNSEQYAIERVVSAFDRMRGQSPAQQTQIAAELSDFGMRFSIVSQSVSTPAMSNAANFAGQLSSQLDGVQTNARERTIEIDFSQLRMMRRRDGFGRPDGPQPEGPPPGEPRPDQHAGPPRDQGNAPPDNLPRSIGPIFPRVSGPSDNAKRNVTELTVDVLLSPGRWLQGRALLPAPRPAPLSIWVAALASMLLVAVSSALIARQIGKPLADLADAAERLGHGETDVAAPVTGPEDVRVASKAFNAMAARLGRQLNRQRQMLWALSHDLRTPITALRLRAELVEDESARQRFLAPLAEMETLTEQALSLARAGVSEEKRVNVDLAEIARTLVGELSDLGISARVETDAPVMAECRPTEIARAMRNLIENAAKYGGGGLVKVYRAEENALFQVDDDGPGLSPDLLARVTEPFFRADAARSEGANGAGLGLAITQAIADGNGGRLVLENRTPHGLSAKLILPAT